MRQDISRLRRNRGLHFSIGLSISLLVSIITLNITVYPEEIEVTNYELEADDFDLEIERTAQRKPPPPPPPKPPTTFENIVETDEVFKYKEPEFEEPQKVEVPINTKVEFKTPPAPVAPLPPPPMPKSDIPEVWKVVQQMPRFGDCDGSETESEYKKCTDKNILSYIHSKLNYPSLARENGVEGTVVVSFVIDETGKITSPKVARDIGAGCGDEVMRVLKGMPDWTPGEQRRKKVKVQFNIPVRFQLD